MIVLTLGDVCYNYYISFLYCGVQHLTTNLRTRRFFHEHLDLKKMLRVGVRSSVGQRDGHMDPTPLYAPPTAPPIDPNLAAALLELSQATTVQATRDQHTTTLGFPKSWDYLVSRSASLEWGSSVVIGFPKHSVESR